MKRVVCLLLCCAVLVAAASKESDELLFQAWKQHHHKQYENAAAEQHAFDNFQLTLQRVGTSAEGSMLNSLADLSPAEFQARYLSGVNLPAPQANARVQYAGAAADRVRLQRTAPTNFDWRNTPGVLSPVRDQGICGSCWAISTTQALESQWYLITNESVVLSPQQLLDCDTEWDIGCKGGNTPTAYKYMAGTAGIESEAAYPYTSGPSGKAGSCKYNASAAVAHVNATVPFVYAIPVCNSANLGCKTQNEYEEALKLALVPANDGAIHGPPSILVNSYYWHDYTGGLYTGPCWSSYNMLHHAVQLVGYNTTAATPYWIVKNSYGTGWGDHGYIYLPIGSNTCGLADVVTFPVVASRPRAAV